MRAVIFDADGTLCFVEHRLHHLDKERKDWPSFHNALINDPPNEPIVWLNKMLAAIRLTSPEPFALLIVTARHEPYRELSEEWFRQNGVLYDKLYMRAEDDFRADDVVKAEILQRITDDGYVPFLVIDDRDSVVEMWRSYGITTLQCAADNPIHQHNGKHLLTLMVGPAGSGKSTYCKKHFQPSQVIASDAIRAEMFGDHTDPTIQTMEANSRVFSYARALVKARVSNGLFTVVDATNLKRKERLHFVRAIPSDVLVEYVLIDRDYDEKIASRGWRPVSLIDNHHRLFKHTTLVEVKEADLRGNVMIKDAIHGKTPLPR